MADIKEKLVEIKKCFVSAYISTMASFLAICRLMLN